MSKIVKEWTKLTEQLEMGENLRVWCCSCRCRRLVAVYTVMFDSDWFQEIARNASLGIPDARVHTVRRQRSVVVAGARGSEVIPGRGWQLPNKAGCSGTA